MLKKNCYILIGDDLTGKTTFQKDLIFHLCGLKIIRLDTNLKNTINHLESPPKLKTLFTMNRSIQEKMGEYKSVENYFINYFKDADICILSSHSHGNSINDITQMIDIMTSKYYNVEAVFFTNQLNSFTAKISKLNWNGRIIIQNPENPAKWEVQINNGALKFSELIIRYSKLN
jgi:hypothetical protein